MDSKTRFIENKLLEKGIYNYTEQDVNFLKKETIDNIFIYKDKEEAFEEAFALWQRKKQEERK